MGLATESRDLATIRPSRIAADYRPVGQGPDLVFIHGLFLSGAVWDEVVRDAQEVFPTEGFESFEMPSSIPGGLWAVAQRI